VPQADLDAALIDTDPGQDDAVAILLALASPEDIEVLGVTAVAGNVPLPLTQKNARIVCELAGEFNIYVDPEAAKIVFDSGVPIVALPLDVTHKALATRARVDAFRAMGTKVGDMVAAWTDFFERFDKEKYGSEGAPLHDPCVIAYLIAPDLFTGRHVNVEIEVSSQLTLGMTVADWWRVTDRAPNALFIGDLDADGFFALLADRLARL